MSQDLVHLYFQRDLSPEEMERLSTTLQDDLEASETFFTLSKQAWERAGLPDPAKADKRKRWLWVLLVLALLTLGFVWCFYPSQKGSIQTLPEVDLDFLQNENAQALSRKGYALALSVRLDYPAKIQAYVQSLDGKLICVLGQGLYPPGTQRFIWNGTSSQGRPAPKGIYHVIVDYGQGKVFKKVVLE
jgi:hypothetical protein